MVNITYLSSYRIMWLFVLFDLPTHTKKQRKNASTFRNELLNLGFEMAQYSVYIKHCTGKEQIETLHRQIARRIPHNGVTQLLSITDKQYENIVTFRNSNTGSNEKKREQTLLF